MPTKKPEVRPVVKLSPANPRLAIAEAKRSAALHAARVSTAEIREAERELRSMTEIGGLIEAIKHRFERRRAFLQEHVALGHGRLEEALEELRCADLRVKNAGGKLLDRDSEVEPWAPSLEVAELLALAQSRRGGAR
jgi:hypothetical protein